MTRSFSNLKEVAQHLIDDNKKCTLLYAFNATGKTRLSMEFKDLVNGEPVVDDEVAKCVLYYNAFTEDLFYWNNDLEGDTTRRLMINLDSRFIEVIRNQGKDTDIVRKFQYYTGSKITPVIDLKNG